jgi:hypothetical protein
LFHVVKTQPAADQINLSGASRDMSPRHVLALSLALHELAMTPRNTAPSPCREAHSSRLARRRRALAGDLDAVPRLDYAPGGLCSRISALL